VSFDAHPPEKIGPTNGPVWQIEVPWSPSSPIVAGDRLFLTAYADDELQTLAYDRASGRQLWKAGVKPAQLEVFHRTDNSPAGPTSVTDGKIVVSYFGSFGLVAYDLDGREKWRHPMPVAVSGGSYGSGTSPLLVGDRVILNRDEDPHSSILALSLKDGSTIWETQRPGSTGSFGTPVVWSNNGTTEVISPGSLMLKAYDAATGVERWVINGLAGFACTTPVVGGGMLYFGAWSPGGAESPFPTWESFSGQNDKNHDGAVTFDELDAMSRDYVRGFDVNHDGKITKEDLDLIHSRMRQAKNQLVAVRPGGSGDITSTHVAWSFNRGLPYVPSPLFYDGRVYMVKDGGMMTSIDAATGKPAYTQERLDALGPFYSSPVAADGRIYTASLNGRVTVIKAGGDKPDVLHRADFGERILATPALAGDNLYLRTEHKLFAFGAPPAR
jgi:outer membrane protein assembly factor BamB